MLRYILRRLLQAIPVFFGTTLLIYFMVFAMPGDPILAMFGERTPPPAVYEQLRQQFNLDKSFFEQYFGYIQNIFTGNMGTTFSGQPVTEQFASAFPVTLQLVLIAVVLEFVLAAVIGLIAGLRNGKIVDHANLIIALVLSS